MSVGVIGTTLCVLAGLCMVAGLAVDLDSTAAKALILASAILFVPGWLMPAEIWQPQLTYFADLQRVVAMDPRAQLMVCRTPDKPLGAPA